MDWAAHQNSWPHAAASQFILCKPHRWHVQVMGKGPLILLIHGAGGATQSWRHLMPLLARTHRVVAVDLPGQGFSESGALQRLGLTAMAQDLRGLCLDQGWQPAAIIGHSAGAALALEMARSMDPLPKIIGLNAALGKFAGPAGVIFPVMAKMLYATPFVARFFARSASQASIKRLLDSTGSRLPIQDLAWYNALISDEAHVDGTLGMMAQWNLDPLLKALPNHPSQVLLVASEGDRTVPPSVSTAAGAKLPHAQVVHLPKLGHLAHEEAPSAVFEAISDFLP